MKILKYHRELDISSRLGYISLYNENSSQDSIYSFIHDIPCVFTRIFAQILDEVFADRLMRFSN